MPASPISPTPGPTSPTDIGKTVLHNLGSGAWQLITTTWWTGPVIAVFIVASLVTFARSVIYPRGRTDPVRRFPRADKAMILARAGGRCEYQGWLFGRCRETKNLEADHVHPHSRGGQTSVANGQALCKRHNREKRANVPFNRSLNALAKRRATYFPTGHDPAVVRYAPRRSRKL